MRKRIKKKALRKSMRKRGPQPIPLALVDPVENESKLVEFSEVPKGIQRRVDEILRAKGLLPAK